MYVTSSSYIFSFASKSCLSVTEWILENSYRMRFNANPTHHCVDRHRIQLDILATVLNLPHTLTTITGISIIGAVVVVVTSSGSPNTPTRNTSATHGLFWSQQRVARLESQQRKQSHSESSVSEAVDEEIDGWVDHQHQMVNPGQDEGPKWPFFVLVLRSDPRDLEKVQCELSRMTDYEAQDDEKEEHRHGVVSSLVTGYGVVKMSTLLNGLEGENVANWQHHQWNHHHDNEIQDDNDLRVLGISSNTRHHNLGLSHIFLLDGLGGDVQIFTGDRDIANSDFEELVQVVQGGKNHDQDDIPEAPSLVNNVERVADNEIAFHCHGHHAVHRSRENNVDQGK